MIRCAEQNDSGFQPIVDKDQAVIEIRTRVAEIQKDLDEGKLQDSFNAYKSLVEKYPTALVLRQGLIGLAGLLGIFDLSIAQELTLLAFQIEQEISMGLISKGQDPTALPPKLLQEQALNKAYDYGLLVLGTELESRIVQLARSFLNAKTRKDLKISLRDQCGVAKRGLDLIYDEIQLKKSVSREKLVHIFTRCLIKQGVITQLISKKASTDAHNGFGWSFFHHLAALGSTELFEHTVDFVFDVFGKEQEETAGLFLANLLSLPTISSLHAAHVAAIRGHTKYLELLKDFLAPEQMLKNDIYHRNALQIAALHRFAFPEVAALLDQHSEVHPTVPAFETAPLVLNDISFWTSAIQSSFTDDSLLLQHIEQADALPLQIDILPEPNLSRFVKDYMTIERPVIIRAQHTQGLKRLQARWRSQNLLKEPRSLQEVTVATIPYADAFSEDGLSITLAQFIAALALSPLRSQNQPLYVFESLHPNSTLAMDSRLVENLLFPPGHISATSRQFYLGEAGSGSPFHFHRAAFNTLVHGKKLWWLIPPRDAIYSAMPMLQFLAQGLELPPSTIQFVQYPGDIVLVPDFWAHATLNLDTSIGVAVEYIWGSSEFSLDTTSYASEPKEKPEKQ